MLHKSAPLSALSAKPLDVNDIDNHPDSKRIWATLNQEAGVLREQYTIDQDETVYQIWCNVLQEMQEHVQSVTSSIVFRNERWYVEFDLQSLDGFNNMFHIPLNKTFANLFDKINLKEDI